MLDLLDRFVAVRDVNRVGEIQQLRLWQSFSQFARDGEATDAGIAHTDGDFHGSPRPVPLAPELAPAPVLAVSRLAPVSRLFDCKRALGSIESLVSISPSV